MINIPNLLTLSNLFCGILGIQAVISGNIESAIWYVLAGAGFDFLDGLVARLMGVSGELGKQLDSLADMVTFGVLPGFLMFEMLGTVSDRPYMPYFGFVITLFSALRLAKFNIDTRQSDTFIGLPTPANTLFFVSLPHIEFEWIHDQFVLAALIAIFSYLLVSEVRMLALKFKSFAIKEAGIKYLVIALAVITCVMLKIPGIAFVIATYVAFSVVKSFFTVKQV